MDMKLVYVPCHNGDEAKSIARRAIEAKLVASADLFPVHSMHVREGSLQEETQVVIIFKTSVNRVTPLKMKVAEWHSGDVPCIIDFTASANEPWGQWLMNSLKNT